MSLLNIPDVIILYEPIFFYFCFPSLGNSLLYTRPLKSLKMFLLFIIFHPSWNFLHLRISSQRAVIIHPLGRFASHYHSCRTCIRLNLYPRKPLMTNLKTLLLPTTPSRLLVSCQTPSGHFLKYWSRKLLTTWTAGLKNSWPPERLASGTPGSLNSWPHELLAS